MTEFRRHEAYTIGPPAAIKRHIPDEISISGI